MGSSKSKSSYEAKNEASLQALPLFSGGILDVCAQTDSGRVVACSDDKTISVLDWKECVNSYVNMTPQRLTGHTRAVNKIYHVGNTLFSVSRDLSIRIWDTTTMQEKHCIPDAHGLNISAITATQNGAFLATGSRDYSVRIRDAESCQLVREYSSPRNVVTCMKYDPSDTLLFQGSEDLCFRVYDSRSSSKIPAKVLSSYVYFPVSVDVHASGHYLASGCKGFNTTGGGEVKLWDLRMDKVVQEFTRHSFDVTGCRFVGDNVLSVSKDGCLSCWSIVNSGVAAYFNIPGTNLLTGIAVLEVSDRAISAAVSSFDGSLSIVQVDDYISNSTSMRVLTSTPFYFKPDREAGDD